MRNNYEAAFVNNTIIPKAEAQRVICITPRTKESEKFVFYFRKTCFYQLFLTKRYRKYLLHRNVNEGISEVLILHSL